MSGWSVKRRDLASRHLVRSARWHPKESTPRYRDRERLSFLALFLSEPFVQFALGSTRLLAFADRVRVRRLLRR